MKHKDKKTEKPMTIKNLGVAAALALGGWACLTPAADAATLNYAEGDLLMGFYSPSETTSYVIDLGAASGYRDGTVSGPLNLGNIFADLNTVFGTEWQTRDDLYWGVFGGTYTGTVNGDSPNTLYASRAFASAYEIASNSSQAQPASKIVNGLGFNAKQLDTVSVNSSVAIKQIDSTHPNQFQDYQQNPNSSFSYFNGAMSTFADGTEGSALYLYRMPTPAFGGTLGAEGSLEGVFTISDTGIVSFSASPVPEPATVALLAIGGLFILLRVRRKMSAARVS